MARSNAACSATTSPNPRMVDPRDKRGTRLGLTGGIGCGKSVAGHLLADLGWQRLDSDELVRALLAGDPEVLDALRARWGEKAVGAGGANRPFIAERVFGEEAELRWLEALLHPRVREQWTGAMAAKPGADWVVEIPLLFEKDLAEQFDVTACVAAPEPIQLARLAAKGLDAAQSQSRIRQQLPVADKARRADHVLSNAGSLEFLQCQVRRLSGMLQRLS